MTQSLQFQFERLEVYRAAREALAIAATERARFRGLPGELASQLERALLSTVANIAEGSGRESPADKRRHYAIARGSANEASSVLEMAQLYGALPAAQHAAMRMLLLRTSWMLTGLLRR